MKGQTAATGGEAGTVTLGGSVGQGLFHSRRRFAAPGGTATEESRREVLAGYRPFSRRVGGRYSIQALLTSLPLLLVDVSVLTATVVAVRLLFIRVGLQDGIDVSGYLLPIATGFILLNFEFGLYPGVKLSPVEELRRLVMSITSMFAVWAVGVATVLSASNGVHRWFLPVVYAACLLTLPIARNWARYLLGKWTNWGLPVLVCGDDLAAPRVFQWLADNHHLGLRPIGVIGDRDALDVGPDDTWYAGPWSETPAIADQRHVFWAVVVPPEGNPAAISSIIADYLYTIPQVHVLTELTGLPDQWNPQRLGELAGIHLQQNLMLPGPRLVKRVMDIVAALVGFVILSPLLFYIAVAVKLSSRGPVLYANERIGRRGRRFRMWKFRSMFTDGDAVLEEYLDANPEYREEYEKTQKLKADPRITRIGRFIRKTSLDELPQLWNVLIGNMSIVGPRPILLSEQEKYGEYYSLYTIVSPGITGMWQVCGRSNTSYHERLQLVAYYVRNWSIWLDICLLLKTVRIVFFGRGAY